MNTKAYIEGLDGTIYHYNNDDLIWKGYTPMKEMVENNKLILKSDHNKVYYNIAGAKIKESVTFHLDNLIEKVIFNNPATIVIWKDGTKTVVKVQEGEVFDPYVGLAMCISKKAMGNQGNYMNIFKKWCEPWYEERYNEICGSDAFIDAINTLRAVFGIRNIESEKEK